MTSLVDDFHSIVDGYYEGSMAYMRVEQALEHSNKVLLMVDQISALVAKALETDGAHHKQWYLEEMARVLGIDLNKIDYEKGVAP